MRKRWPKARPAQLQAQKKLQVLQRVEIAKAPPPFAKAVHGRGAVRDGLLYQAKVSAHFEALYGFEYLADLWINYYLGEEFHTCSPDGILVDLKGGRIVIVEVKRTHTSRAFVKMRNVYLPILQEGLSRGSRRQAPRLASHLQDREGGGGYAGFLPPPSRFLTDQREVRPTKGPKGEALWTYHLVEVCPSYDPLDSGGERVSLVRNLQNLAKAEDGVNVLIFKKPPRWNR